MNEVQTGAGDTGPGVFDCLIVFAKRKKTIIGITFSSVIAAFLISLILPKIYVGETRILPHVTQPQYIESFPVASDILAFTGGVGVTSTADIYVGMLKGRTILDRVIDRFDLRKLYDKKTYLETRKHMLQNVFSAEADPASKIILLSAEDKDPKRAADMANAFVEELVKLNREIASSEAVRRKTFFEGQMAGAKQALVVAEEGVRAFQGKTGIFRLEEQAKTTISLMADLEAQITAKEVQLGMMKTYATPQNPDLRRLESELKGLKAELSKLKARGSQGDPIVSAGNISALNIEYMGKLRDLKYNETLFDLFLKQFEAAKLDEAKSFSIVQVVDYAVPPDKHAKPKRLVMMAIAGFGGFFLSIFQVIFSEYVANHSDAREKLKLLRQYSRFRLRR